MKSRRTQSQHELQQNFFQQGRLQHMGMSNSMMQERLRQSNPTYNMSLATLTQDLQSEGYEVSSNIDAFINSNVYKAMERLVNKEKWEPEFAAAWLGQAVVETGNEDLSDLDVVEKGSGAGRGMFQYTDSRRGPYDRARSQALQQGQDPNDINWQIDYALEKDNAALNFDRFREGLTDPNKNYKFQPKWGTASGYSPTGYKYKDKFADSNALMKAYGKDKIGGYSRALTGEYTRAGTPHLERRNKMSKHILQMYRAAKKRTSKPKMA